ncbi:SDR family NAD(P)-dependent oxidoreductase [Radiobacillus sp. PE A8.2]|uniref:SDR family NAD(P)-dependent oxidoreductase n=1 Tax=Radiobacillus sp. PE A8.2 TaxID=3380349 RepID=UPI00388E8ED5
MKKALVIGASGGMGYAIVNELTSRGIKVNAFARNQEKLERLFQHDSKVTIKKGDAFDCESLMVAAEGVDVIFQASNIPYYQWEKELPKLTAIILEVTKAQSAKLAVVDNIYAYGKTNQQKVTEATSKSPNTKKGKVRLSVEKKIKQSGVSAVVAHFPDFYGPNAENTLIHYTLTSVINNKKAMFVGNQKLGREFIFTPDGAKAIVELAMCEEAYGQNWNIPGYGVITGEEMIAEIRTITNYNKPVSTVTKNMIRFLGLFNRMMREAVEMYYLNEDPVVLSGEKYENEFGLVPATSYQEGLKQTIDYMAITK